ncbi:DUF5017 domain-containing protein [Chitinophaga lutea]
MKKIYYSLFVLLLAAGCSREEDIDISGFNVETGALTYKAGEEVTFKLTGDPSQLAFYSGEVGNEYAFKDQARIDKLDKLMFSFETHNAPTEVVNYQVMLSTDFDGVYEYSHVAAAKWTDISARFTWGAPAAWQTGWTSSGIKDIADVVTEGKPFYIAFKYLAPAVPSGTVPGRNWRTRGHVLDAVTIYGYTINEAVYSSMGWKQVKKDPAVSSGSTVTSSIMLFGASTTYRLEYEEWGVSKAFQVDDVNLGSDKSVALKGYADMPLTEYKHTYNTPGKYKVTFVAANRTAHNNDEVIRQLDLTIVP